MDESFQLRLFYITKSIWVDGVIIATPEHNHTISAASSVLLEWLSFEVHPFENKPVVIKLVLSTTIKGLHVRKFLRKILDAPRCQCLYSSRKWILLRKAFFDEDGNIINEGTVKFL